MGEGITALLTPFLILSPSSQKPPKGERFLLKLLSAPQQPQGPVSWRRLREEMETQPEREGLQLTLKDAL